MKLNLKKIFALLISANSIFTNISAMNNRYGIKQPLDNTESRLKALEENYNQVCFLMYFLAKCKGELVLISNKKIHFRPGVSHSVFFDKIVNMSCLNDVFLELPNDPPEKRKRFRLFNNLLIDQISKCGFKVELLDNKGHNTKIKFGSIKNIVNLYSKEKINMVGLYMSSLMEKKLKNASKNREKSICITAGDIKYIDEIVLPECDKKPDDYLVDELNVENSKNDLNKLPNSVQNFNYIVEPTYSIKFVHLSPDKQDFTNIDNSYSSSKESTYSINFVCIQPANNLSNAQNK